MRETPAESLPQALVDRMISPRSADEVRDPRAEAGFDDGESMAEQSPLEDQDENNEAVHSTSASSSSDVHRVDVAKYQRAIVREMQCALQLQFGTVRV